MSVDEHTTELAGSPLFYRSAPATGTAAMYLHGVPTSSDDFVGLLDRAGGIAPDLIGFGRSGKGGHLDYSIAGLADAAESLLAGRVKLIGHQWGAAVALELAARHPETVQSLVLCNPLALIDGFEWPRPARIWRAPALGELAMGATNRWLLGRLLRRGAAREDVWTSARVNAVWKQFDQGTQRAILRLHRRTGPHALDGTLKRVHATTLILWGDRDPWLDQAPAERIAARLPDATLERLPDAGHWPWLDRPEIAERIASL